MTKREFLKLCGILGLSFPLQSVLSQSDKSEASFSGEVIIIGAGAAGLSAGYLLAQRGIKFRILEASSNFGGRLKRTLEFADFPIPLGAEWLHVGPEVFEEITNGAPVTVKTIGYNADDRYAVWENGALTFDELGDYDDRKFVNSSWFDFFEEYVVPTVAPYIHYHTEVKAIDYSAETVIVETATERFFAEKVLLTVPLKILQAGDISFTPALPQAKVKAIQDATVWGGIKVFLEFSKKFYPSFTEFVIEPESAGQVAYYDAAYGQETNKHILGLFAVGVPAEAYTSLTGDALRDYILEELDMIFAQQASPHYVKHLVQNWSQEPFIRGAYISDYEDWKRVRKLSESVADKLYFAGEAYTSGEDWGGVHAAAEAAREAVEELSG
ncbi:MAG: FAD-dependent oxidoreductase [Trueperaceae bacterium]|nr:FAD-dependent oxidoreductase [Trueperaceae bacterium]